MKKMVTKKKTIDFEKLKGMVDDNREMHKLNLDVEKHRYSLMKSYHKRLTVLERRTQALFNSTLFMVVLVALMFYFSTLV